MEPLNKRLQQKKNERILRLSSKATPTPAPVPSPLVTPASFVVLGKDVDTGQPVTLEQKARPRGVYEIGKTGSGKTTLLENASLQDIEQGRGVGVIEPHGDAINDILARIPKHREKDVILLDLLDTEHPFGLNLYHCNNPADDKQVSRTVNYVMEVFAKLFADGDILFSHMPRMAEVLRNTAYTLIANPGTTMAEIPILLKNEDARTKLIRNVTNPQVRLFWEVYNRMKPNEQREFYDSTTNKLDIFLTDPIIQRILGQSKPTLNFREIIDTKKILLVKLSRNYAQLTALVGSVIVGQIANAVFSRSDTPEDKRVQFNLFCDEYQRFSTPTFAELLTEARKYKIGVWVSHQSRGQLDQANKVATLNTATLIVFAVEGAEDAPELAKQLKVNLLPTEPRLEPVLSVTSKPVEHLKDHKHRNDRVNTLFDKYVSPRIDADAARGIFLVRHGHIDDMSLYAHYSLFFRNAMYGIPITNTKQLEFIHFVHLNLLITRLHYGRHPMYEFPPAIRNSVASFIYHDLLNYSQALQNWGSGIPQFYQPDTRKDFEAFVYSYQGYGKFGVKEEAELYRTCLQFWINQIFCCAILSPPGIEPTEEEKECFKRVYSNVAQTETQSTAEFKEWKLRNELHHDRNRGRVADLPYYPYHPRLGVAQKDEVAALFMKYMSERATNPVMIKRHQMAEKLAQEDLVIVKDIIGELDEFARLLQAEPIMVSSGQYEEKPGLPETIANAQNRVANELANPKKKYTARVKLEDGSEHVIEIEETEQFKHAAAPFDVQVRRHGIVTQTRTNYCKKKTEVEKEIAARQTELMKPEKKKARTQQDEDEKEHETKRTPAQTEKEPEIKLAPAQTEKLRSIKAELAEDEYNLFINDPLVQEYLSLVIDMPELTVDAIGEHLTKWLMVDSPSYALPFAELMKELLARRNAEKEIKKITLYQEELINIHMLTHKDAKVIVPHTVFSSGDAERLKSMRALLGDDDYYLFTRDPFVRINLRQLLDKSITCEQIRGALDKWREAGSPAGVSPFAELIKKLLG